MPHPAFGAIPLVPVVHTDAVGGEHAGFDYDPDYAPPLPKGAVRGDIRRQDYCRICDVPRYFFVDLERVCVACGRTFTFGAKEQKYWYETLKFNLDSTAIRCAACRRSRRSDVALQRELAAAKVAVRAKPDDPATLVRVAAAIVRNFERKKQGPLAEAIAASRKARRLLKGHSARELGETLFWEGAAHALAGRPGVARELLVKFLDSGSSSRRHGALAKEARRWLEPPK